MKHAARIAILIGAMLLLTANCLGAEAALSLKRGGEAYYVGLEGQWLVIDRIAAVGSIAIPVDGGLHMSLGLRHYVLEPWEGPFLGVNMEVVPWAAEKHVRLTAGFSVGFAEGWFGALEFGTVLFWAEDSSYFGSTSGMSVGKSF